jgi:hypothetical protein
MPTPQITAHTSRMVPLFGDMRGHASWARAVSGRGEPCMQCGTVCETVRERMGEESWCGKRQWQWLGTTGLVYFWWLWKQGITFFRLFAPARAPRWARRGRRIYGYVWIATNGNHTKILSRPRTLVVVWTIAKKLARPARPLCARVIFASARAS